MPSTGMRSPGRTTTTSSSVTSSTGVSTSWVPPAHLRHAWGISSPKALMALRVRIHGVVLTGSGDGERAGAGTRPRPFAQDSRAGCGGQHQHVGVKLAAEQAGGWRGWRRHSRRRRRSGCRASERRFRAGQRTFRPPIQPGRRRRPERQESASTVLHPMGQKRLRAAVVVLLVRLYFGTRRAWAGLPSYSRRSVSSAR